MTGALLWSVFAVSCGVLAFEIALMRILLYASWHHFAFLVISIVLLGFGASGTVLCFVRSRVVARAATLIPVLVVAAGVSMPLCVALAQHIPIEARFVPALLAQQVLRWVLYWIVLTVPFFIGALAIGAALMTAGPRVAAVYGTNLAGSALGAVVATVAMHVLAPAWLPLFCGFVALLGGLGLSGSFLRRLLVVMVPSVVIAAWLVARPPSIRVDEFKYRSYVTRLVAEDRAAPVARALDSRAVVEVFRGSAFHNLPFLEPGEAPPEMLAILFDGHWAGSLLDVSDAEGARVVDRTLMSVPYVFAAPEPRVLLLGETGGANAWLAARRGATAVDVVEPHRSLSRLLTGALRDDGGSVFALPGVRVAEEEPRHFVEHARGRYDLIQLASLESWAVESGGVAGLNQDYLVTVEGFAACLSRLGPDGILAMGRGIQIPPRDNSKLLATAIAALRLRGVNDPGRHIVVVRDFLAACIMVKASPWRASEITRLRALCGERELTPVYFEGVAADELNYPDALPGPPGESGDWLHYSVVSLLAADAASFIEGWPFDIRPPTDDRPFFANFSRLGSTGALREAYGELWMTRTELGLLFVVAAMAIIFVIGVLLTVLPLLFVPGIRRASGRFATSVYFVAIGLAYLMLEITMLSRLAHLLGDVVLTGAVTIAGFLFFSGAGSLAAQRLSVRAERRLVWLLVAIVAVGLTEMLVMGFVIRVAGGAPMGVRLAVAILLIAPLGFLMGFPMPVALRRLGSGSLVPWAWGLNGFASVMAPPLATALAMSWGFVIATVVALGCYGVAAGVFGRLPRGAV